MKKKFELSATALKVAAIIAMTIDHCAFAFVPADSAAYFIMRFFGRLTAPIMSFFIAEGFVYTKSRKKYFSRLLIFGLISQPFYITLILGRIPTTFLEYVSTLNVMFTFALSLLSLQILTEKKLPTVVKAILIGACFMLADICDWSYIIPAWTIIFFLFRKEKAKRNTAFIAVSVVLLILRYLPCYKNIGQFSFMFGVIPALILISLYNGKRFGTSSPIIQKISRRGFYVYYPLHIFVIILIKNLL